jgi:hypothetical protein
MASTEVEDFYTQIDQSDIKEEDNPNFDVHGLKIPFRMLIVGASGSRKTNTALDIIQKCGDTFFNITICCRNGDEPLYKLLKKNIPADQLSIVEIEGDDLQKIPKINKIDKKHPSLVVFDDLVLVKDQETICEFFIRARKVNCSIMYLTQAYYETPKTIRSNCNYIVLKKIASKRDLDMILREYTLGVDDDQLRQLYTECTRKPLDWLMVSIDDPPEKRFRHNYQVLNDVDTVDDGHEPDTQAGNSAVGDQQQPHQDQQQEQPDQQRSYPNFSQQSSRYQPRDVARLLSRFS